MRHLLSILDLSVEEIAELLAAAGDILDHPDKYRDACRGRILAALFFEPSIRTWLSFESAMLGLGGRCWASTTPRPAPLGRGRAWRIPSPS